MMLATLANHPAVVELLLSEGASPDSPDYNKCSACRLALLNAG